MRPGSTYTEAIADEICTRIAEGEPLRQICRDKRMPAWRTVYAWLDAHEQFRTNFTRAREVGYDAIAEEALRIADTPLEGDETETETEDDSGRVKKKVKRSDMLGHRKLQVETRLKLLAKWSPKKYGDRQEVDLKAKLDVSDMSEAEIRAELATLTAGGVI